MSKLQNNTLTRYVSSNNLTSNLDVDKKIATFSFSSTEPVERWAWFEESLEGASNRFYEILSHDTSHIRLDRVKNGVCPFLENHRMDQRLGKIIEVKVQGERAYATAKLGRSALANQYRDDVEDGVEPGKSFMYRVYKYEVVKAAEYEGEGWGRKLKTPATLKAVDWELFEVSNVSIPADFTVGNEKSNPVYDLRSVEIVGEANFERGAKEMPGENEDLNLIKRENESLRSQIESLTKENAGLKDQIKGLTFKTEITGAYTTIRQRAEQLVREAKLSKAEFDAEFTTNSETHLRSILAMEESEARFELRHFERLLDTFEKRAPLLSTSLKTDGEPLPKTEAQKDEQDQESAETYAKQFAEKTALPSWKTYKPVA